MTERDHVIEVFFTYFDFELVLSHIANKLPHIIDVAKATIANHSFLSYLNTNNFSPFDNIYFETDK